MIVSHLNNFIRICSWVLLLVIFRIVPIATTEERENLHLQNCSPYCDCENPEYDNQEYSISFLHETCTVRNLSGYNFHSCYKIRRHTSPYDIIKIFVKLQGHSDGHVRLEDDFGVGYEVIFGSHSNLRTEIRTVHEDHTDVKTKALIQTEGILSPDEFKTFVVEFDKIAGKVLAFMLETGRKKPLISWVDKRAIPIEMEFVRFSAYNDDQIVQVAFNCKATDRASDIYQLGNLIDGNILFLFLPLAMQGNRLVNINMD